MDSFILGEIALPIGDMLNSLHRVVGNHAVSDELACKMLPFPTRDKAGMQTCKNFRCKRDMSTGNEQQVRVLRGSNYVCHILVSCTGFLAVRLSDVLGAAFSF